ncbi:hypothetical protein [Paenibacillus hubeiensis]|uniref:hypothetical protein n=1 Tax=Paenibacillus hubeiensis TaxID=3077330 RepID=UPI0031BB35FB
MAVYNILTSTLDEEVKAGRTNHFYSGNVSGYGQVIWQLLGVTPGTATDPVGSSTVTMNIMAPNGAIRYANVKVANTDITGLQYLGPTFPVTGGGGGYPGGGGGYPGGGGGYPGGGGGYPGGGGGYPGGGGGYPGGGGGYPGGGGGYPGGGGGYPGGGGGYPGGGGGYPGGGGGYPGGGGGYPGGGGWHGGIFGFPIGRAYTTSQGYIIIAPEHTHHTRRF